MRTEPLVWLGVAHALVFSLIMGVVGVGFISYVAKCRVVDAGVVDSGIAAMTLSTGVFEYGDKIMMYQGDDGETLCWVSAGDDGGIGDGGIEGPEPWLCLRAMVEAMQRPKCP